MKYRNLIVILAVLFLMLAASAACRQSPATPSPVPSSGPDAANGERIYFTAASKRGERITFTGGPSIGGMMGTYLTCAACHGPAGRGGEHIMQMTVMEAADIRYATIGEEFDLVKFGNAVREGQDPDGSTLDTNMPLWRISDQDLADVWAFLKLLP